MEMGAADAYQHTDSNRNHDGSDIVHGTLKSGNRVWRIIVKPYIITNDYNTEGDPMRFFFAEKLAFIRNNL
jgi:hypothetical protein